MVGEPKLLKPISSIDAEKGILAFRGYDATNLARDQAYESVLFLLINGALPTGKESLGFRNRLLGLRKLAEPEIPTIVENIVGSRPSPNPRITDGYERTEMLGLRVLAKNLDSYAEKFNLDREETLLLFVAMAPLVLASGLRYLQRKEIIPPRDDLEYSHNFYWMTTGSELPQDEVRDLETCIILHMDDPENPSLAKLEECIRHGRPLSETLVKTLDEHVGPLHHGAGELSMQTILDIDDETQIDQYLLTKLRKGELIYGLGHRIYQTLDPRARVLKEVLGRRTSNSEIHALANRIEEIARVGCEIILREKKKVVHPNVDLYNAAVYYTFGFPYFMNTELFAVSRSAGWAAHILELN